MTQDKEEFDEEILERDLDFISRLLHHYQTPEEGVRTELEHIESGRVGDIEQSKEALKDIIRFLEPMKDHPDYKNLWEHSQKILGGFIRFPPKYYYH